MVQPIVNLIRLNRLVGDVAAASLLLADIERSFWVATYVLKIFESR